MRDAGRRAPSRPPAGSRSGLAVRAALAAALFAGSVIAFWPVLGNGFTNFDDDEYVTENPAVREGLTARGVAWAFRSTHAANWHPLTWLSHMLDVEIYGLSSGGHHLTSLLLHAANAALLFLLLDRLTGRPWPSAAATLLFAVHPLRTESVAWVAERKDVLSTAFLLATMLAYAAYARSRRRALFALVAGLLLLGLMAKPMLVTAPVLLLLLDVWPLRRLDLSRGAAPMWTQVRPLLLEKAPLLGLALVSAVVTVAAQHAAGAVGSLERFPLGERVANALVSCVAYLRDAVAPTRLAAFYPHPVAGYPFWQVAASAALLAALTWLVLRLRRSHPCLAFGWLWYLATLVPVLGIVQVGDQARADRYTYVPQIGLAVAVCWGIADLTARLSERGAPLARQLARVGPWVVGVAAPLVLTAMSLAQAATWKDSVTLFSRALEVTRDNYVAHMNLGNALGEQGRLEEAISHYRQALRLRPDFAMAHYNLGLALERAGREDEAAAELLKALEFRPRHAESHFKLGLALARTGRFEEAVGRFRQAIDSRPEFPEAWYNLGRSFVELKRLDAAEEAFRRAVDLRGDWAEARYNLGAVLLLRNDIAAAAREIRRAQELGYAVPPETLRFLATRE